MQIPVSCARILVEPPVLLGYLPSSQQEGFIFPNRNKTISLIVINSFKNRLYMNVPPFIIGGHAQERQTTHIIEWPEPELPILNCGKKPVFLKAFQIC